MTSECWVSTTKYMMEIKQTKGIGATTLNSHPTDPR